MPAEPSKTRQLRALLDPARLDFLMEAHNGLSARIAEEAGFRGIWASGLSIAASLGVRDNNEASWTQVLDVVEFMADATKVPILIDGDTGYGNFNNFRRLVQKLEQRGVAGVCIEDKVFPKTNSFLRGTAQPLAAIEEFSGKIKAGKDAQTDRDFVIVARVEALIAGWGHAEAIRRAEAYRQAGADAILIHSALSKPDEIFAFLEEWGNRHPVVLVPTKYHTTPTDAFAQRQVALVIWANHLIRSAVTAMQATAARIHHERRITGVEETVAPLREIFRLQGDDELKAAEDRFLAAAARRSAIILAATRGGGPLHPLTMEVPKTLLRVGGVSLLDRLCDNLNASNVRDLTVVAGYRKEAIRRTNLQRIDNDAWETTGEIASLALAAAAIRGPGLVVFGDILCRRHILQTLLDDESDLVIAVDRHIRREAGDGVRARDLVKLSGVELPAFLDGDVHVTAAAFTADVANFDAEWIGVLKYSEAGAAALRDWLVRAATRPDFARLGLVDALEGLRAAGHPVKAQVVAGGWTTIESAIDLAEASNL